MEKIEVSALGNTLKTRFDLFICSTSFESRCLTVASNLSKENCDRIAIYNYENNYVKALENLIRIKDIAEKAQVQFEERTIKPNEPLFNCDSFVELLFQQSPCSNILIDISTFTRENLLILVKLAKSVFKSLNFFFCYTPSHRYATNKNLTLADIKEYLWLSRGVEEVRSVLGFPGEFSPLKKMLLIVLSGFEYDRAQILIDSYEPNRLFIGLASKAESINNGLFEVNELVFQMICSNNPSADFFEFSCKDLSITKNTLEGIIDTYKDEYNIVISPMNNKWSTLAVASVALNHPEVQICYATTNQYNTESYSQECDYVYFMSSREV